MKPYNPLEKENLGKSVADSLMKQSPVPLASVKNFEGAGIYVIYYTGDREPYARLGKMNCGEHGAIFPIYIGKAVPSGGRKGLISPNISAKGKKLFKRLEEHRKSIDEASNLDIADFSCRYLVVDDVWIPLGESLLIERHKPLWNSVIDGFGNHTPGKGRFKGARPSWDTLHPGRHWAEKCEPSKLSAQQIHDHIEQYWAKFDAGHHGE